MVLILAGGGTIASVNVTQKFLSFLEGNKHLGVIADARTPSEHDSTIYWVTNELLPKNHGCHVTLVGLQDLTLDDYDGLIIAGGNTFMLLDAIKRNSSEVELLRFINQKKPLYGISAGAIIMGASISTAFTTDNNIVGLNDLTGLDVLGGIGITCHYLESNFDAKRFSRDQHNKLIIALSEGSAVIFEPSTKNLQTLGDVYLI